MSFSITIVQPRLRLVLPVRNALAPSRRHRRAFTTLPPLLKAQEPLSKSTSDLLDQLEREARRQGKMPSGSGAAGAGGATGGAAGVGADGMGNVGPFPMGVGLGSGARTRTWDKWSDLSAAGKSESATRSAEACADGPFPPSWTRDKADGQLNRELGCRPRLLTSSS